MLPPRAAHYALCSLLLIAGAGAQGPAAPVRSGAAGLQTAVGSVESLIEAQQFDQAKQAALEALQHHPHSAELNLQLGTIAAAQGDTTGAEQRYQLARHEAPGSTAPLLALARLYLEHPQQYTDAEDRAATLYTAATRMQPHDAEANAELALIEYRRAKYEAAEKLLANVRGEAETSPLVQALRCGSAAALHGAAAAQSACASLAHNPQAVEQDAELAATGLRAGERADLIVPVFAAVQSRQPLSPAGLRWLGLAQDAAGDSPAARQTLEQAYAAAPQDTSLLLQLATVAEREDKGQEALGYLAHARELQPHNAAVQAAFAQQCAKLGLLGEARNAMQLALAADPDNPENNLFMGKVTALSQDPLSAKPFLLKYHSLRPADPQGTLLLGVIEYRAKEFDDARPWLQQAANQPSTAAEADLYLGSGARQLGDLANAETFLTRSEKLDPQDAETHAELGLLALAQHDPQAASQQLTAALKLDGNSYTANYGLLQLYAQTKDPRRPEQLKRFEAIKEQTDTLNRQAMRVVEVRRDADAPPAHAQEGAGAPQ